MGPAHTVGDAVAFLPREGILFTGDLCVNWKSGNNMGIETPISRTGSGL